jgi:hypothetical protein
MRLKDFFKTSSEISPKGGNKGCLCEDGSYSKECCDGSLQAQGIGSENSQGISIVNNVNEVRTMVREN